jgi:hypothetical protein
MTLELFLAFMTMPIGGAILAGLCVYLFTGPNQRF